MAICQNQIRIFVSSPKLGVFLQQNCVVNIGSDDVSALHTGLFNPIAQLGNGLVHFHGIDLNAE
jgi:hypothetical protein